MGKTKLRVLDCTLRDGGYYNNWDFDPDLINDYLEAMDSLKIDFVEIGFTQTSNFVNIVIHYRIIIEKFR